MTEVHYEPPGARPELLEATPGEHLWVAVAAFRVSAQSLRGRVTDTINLDRENLAVIDVGCYVCEQPWSERLSYRRCPGEPTGDEGGG